MILILIPNLSFLLHSFIVLVALKRAVLLDLGQCLNTDTLSSKFFVDGFANIYLQPWIHLRLISSVSVPTTSAVA